MRESYEVKNKGGFKKKKQGAVKRRMDINMKIYTRGCNSIQKMNRKI